MLLCAICRKNEVNQEHHLSYYPEIKIDICDECHKFLHGHTVGIVRQTSRNLLSELREKEKQFITRTELESLASKYNLNFKNIIRSMSTRKWIKVIFRGVYYIPSLEEKNTGNSDLSALELISQGLKYKNITNHYFGLHSALWKNGIIDEPKKHTIINDKKQQKERKTLNKKIEFLKISPRYTKNGIIQDSIPYSDLEKTVLDLIYIYKYRGMPDAAIWVTEIKKINKPINHEKIKIYLADYPKTVNNFIYDWLFNNRE